jgi:tetratricopeptide (TPR) repeat protein
LSTSLATPLALRLLLPHLRTHDASNILDGLATGQEVLAPQTIPAGDRTHSLEISLSWPLGQLEPAKLDRLRALSLFEDVAFDWWLDAFSAEKGCPMRFADAQLTGWQALLEEAARLGLANPLGLGCFRLHPALPGILHRYWLDAAGNGFAAELKAASAAFITAAAQLSKHRQKQVRAGEAELAARLVGLLRRSLGKTLSLGLATARYEECRDIFVLLSQYWVANGLFAEADWWTKKISAALGPEIGGAPDPANAAGELWLLLKRNEAERALASGRNKEAEQVYLGLVAALEQMTSDIARWHLADGYFALGDSALRKGELKDAERRYREALAIFEAMGDQRGIAQIYSKFGRLAHLRFQLTEAEGWYRRAATTFEKLGDRPFMANAYHRLGWVTYDQGRLDEAENWYDRGRAIFEQLNDSASMASTTPSLFGENAGESAS